VETAGLKVYVGHRGKFEAWYFGVHGTFISEIGIPSVGLGPRNEFLAHTPEDMVPVRERFDAARIYSTLMLDMCE
jgi:acetylornithine deacetylase/succinyl-diaminopimelate desuccinylase-like protein